MLTTAQNFFVSRFEQKSCIICLIIETMSARTRNPSLYLY